MTTKYMYLCGKCASELYSQLNLKLETNARVKATMRKKDKCEYCRKAKEPDLYKAVIK